MRDIKFRVWDGKEYHYDIAIYDGKAYIPDHGLLVEPVENAIIEQYTGLKDKNGKEIYEGDIVECDMIYGNGSLPHMGEIVYCECGSYATKNLCGKTLLHNHRSGTYEIIGNIHETPELLKDEHDESS